VLEQVVAEPPDDREKQQQAATSAEPELVTQKVC